MRIPKRVAVESPNRSPLSVGYTTTSLSFSRGDGSYVDIPNNDTVNLDNFTILLWMNMQHDATNDEYWFCEAHGTQYNAFHFQHDNGNELELQIWDTGGTTHACDRSFEPTIGRWYFIGGSYDGSTMKVYLNGDVYETLNASFTPADDGSDWYMGPSNVEYVEAIMDEVMIYSRVLSLSEIRYNMLNYHRPVENGLVSHWRMEEGTGTTVKDRVNGNDGAMNNFPSPYGWVERKKSELRAEAGL